MDFAVATRLSAAVAQRRDPSAPAESDRKRALLLPSAGKDASRGDGSRQGSRDLFLLPDRVGECVAGEKISEPSLFSLEVLSKVFLRTILTLSLSQIPPALLCSPPPKKKTVAQGIDEGWWGRAGVQSGVAVSCRSRDPGDLNFLNRGGSASTSSSSSMFDLVLSRGGLAAASSSSNSGGLSDLLAGAARILKPGSGVLVAAERLGGSPPPSALFVRGLTGLGGASASLSLAELEKALEAAPGFSKIALDVVCSGTDPHAIVVAFRDETSAFGVGGRSVALSAGTEEEDALAAALKTKRGGKGGGSKKGFK